MNTLYFRRVAGIVFLTAAITVIGYIAWGLFQFTRSLPGTSTRITSVNAFENLAHVKLPSKVVWVDGELYQGFDLHIIAKVRMPQSEVKSFLKSIRSDVNLQEATNYEMRRKVASSFAALPDARKKGWRCSAARYGYAMEVALPQGTEQLTVLVNIDKNALASGYIYVAW